MTPDEHTNQEFFLDVGDGHQLYVHDWGNPKAKTPIIYLHGGPGANCDDNNKLTFDPSIQRVIFHDQRGSGKSLPYGSLTHNTTAELVQDIEKIALRLKLKKIILTGGSWGSCLALAYALEFPERPHALVLRGIFTGSQAEIDYVDKGLWHTHFPDLWDWYVQQVPKKHQQNPSRYLSTLILGNDTRAAKQAASVYSRMEGALVRLDARYGLAEDPDYDPTGQIIETNYMVNRCFMPDQYLLEHASKLKMPVYIVQGRYDFIGPPRTAYDLHSVLPNSWLNWTIAGHSGNDRESWSVVGTILRQLTIGV